MLLKCIITIDSFQYFKIEAAPFQSIPSRAGYIPVYIRFGDEPLENINP